MTWDNDGDVNLLLLEDSRTKPTSSYNGTTGHYSGHFSPFTFSAKNNSDQKQSLTDRGSPLNAKVSATAADIFRFKPIGESNTDKTIASGSIPGEGPKSAKGYNTPEGINTPWSQFTSSNLGGTWRRLNRTNGDSNQSVKNDPKMSADSSPLTSKSVC